MKRSRNLKHLHEAHKKKNNNNKKEKKLCPYPLRPNKDWGDSYLEKEKKKRKKEKKRREKPLKKFGVGRLD